VFNLLGPDPARSVPDAVMEEKAPLVAAILAE